MVRDNSGVTNTAHHDFTYSYDPNGNLTGIADSSPGTAIGTYAVSYDGINQVAKVEEQAAGITQHTTTYGYDAAGNLTSRGHDAATSAYTYDLRNLLATETDAQSSSDPSPQVTSFTYTPAGQAAHEVKPNGNTVDDTYFADGLLAHQIEATSAGTTVAEHTYTYNPDGNKAQDVQKLMNADTNTAYLTHTLAYSYDPRDRIAQVTKDGTITESYLHDANDNVTQTSGGTTTTTTYSYDRNRLLTSTAGGFTSGYNYDPFGRLDTITFGGQIYASDTYDGFDHIVQHEQQATGGTDTTSYTYDPLDRRTSQTTGVGTASPTTTGYAYLGLSNDLITETPAGGQVAKSYTYTPGGARLSQTAHNSDGTTTPGYYTYNDHSDVEAVTGSSGGTTATYGYSAYGGSDLSQFTGADKPNTGAGGGSAPPFNVYRYNAMRWDSSTGQYDMGFRNYDPGLNQFLTRDMYDGALADMNLTTDPFTGSRYTFGAGNPITNIEQDGHMLVGSGGSSPQKVVPICPIGMLACFGALGGSFGSGLTEAPPKPQAPPVGGQNPPGSGDMGWLRWLPALAAALAASSDVPPQTNTQDRSRACFTSGEPQGPDYGPLSFSGGATEKGRATWAEACLTTPVKSIPKSPSPDFPGFNEKTMDRAHLLARWFGGRNFRRNRVLLWRNANQQVMRGIENAINADLQAGERVYYFAQPVYALGPTGPGDYQPYMPVAIDVTYGTAGDVETVPVYNNP